MLELRRISENLDLSIEDLLELVPEAKDKNEDYNVLSIETARIKKKQRIKDSLDINIVGNDLRTHNNNKRFHQFLDNVKPTKETGNIFAGKKVSISMNYEDHHYKQTLNLIQLIVNEGGEVILKASLSDIYFKYDVILEDGSLRNDSRLNYVNEAIRNGKKIEIIEFEELLQRLNISENELDKMPLPSFDFLYKKDGIKKYKKNKNVIKKHFRKKGRTTKKEKNEAVYSINKNIVTLGDIFGDIFASILNEEKE